MALTIEQYFDYEAPEARHQHGHRRQTEWNLATFDTSRHQKYFNPTQRWNPNMSAEDADEANANAAPASFSFISQYKWAAENDWQKKKRRAINQSRTRKHQATALSHEQDWFTVNLEGVVVPLN